MTELNIKAWQLAIGVEADGVFGPKTLAASLAKLPVPPMEIRPDEISLLMPSVREIAEEIVAREGGFVNDPDDPGGATNYGVTIGTMRMLGYDLDNDNDVDIADVRALTKAQAVDIYIKHYFEKPGIAKLPKTIQASVFDMYVNSGNNAVKILQRLMAGLGHPGTVDGRIGPQTIEAAHEIDSRKSDFNDLYGIARRSYYYSLGDSRAASRKYARRRDGGKGGWIVRAEEFISPKYHLTMEQHRARTAAWG